MCILLYIKERKRKKKSKKKVKEATQTQQQYLSLLDSFYPIEPLLSCREHVSLLMSCFIIINYLIIKKHNNTIFLYTSFVIDLINIMPIHNDTHIFVTLITHKADLHTSRLLNNIWKTTLSFLPVCSKELVRSKIQLSLPHNKKLDTNLGNAWK